MQACSDSPPGEEPMMSGIWRWTSNYDLLSRPHQRIDPALDNDTERPPVRGRPTYRGGCPLSG